MVSYRLGALISCYQAAVWTQSPKVDMIASLFKPVSGNYDEEIIYLVPTDELQLCLVLGIMYLVSRSCGLSSCSNLQVC